MAAALLATAISLVFAPSTVTAQEGTSPGRVVEATHEAEGVKRSYRLVLPEAAPEEGRALVVMLHGCTQDADDFATGTRMDRYALRQGFLVLYPEQPANLHPQRCWRWYEEANQRRESGEAAQLMAMIRDVMEEHSVDPGRVYVAGISAGGAMALVLAATHPESFAAVASHSGVAYAAARNQGEAVAAMAGKGPPVDALARRLERAIEAAGAGSLPPLLVIHGTEDEAVDPSNADSLAEAWVKAGVRGSGPTPKRYQLSHGWATFWESGERRLVTLTKIPEMGHAWAGGDPAGSYTDPAARIRVDATERVLASFARTAGDEALDPEGSQDAAGEDSGRGSGGDPGRDTAGGGGP